MTGIDAVDLNSLLLPSETGVQAATTQVSGL